MHLDGVPLTDLRDLHFEVVKQLERLAESKASKARLRWFQQQHKGSELVFHGISIPDVRRLNRRFKDRFEQLSLQNQLDPAGIFRLHLEIL